LGWEDPVYPCVFKPKSNVHGDRVQYPQICLTSEEEKFFRLRLRKDDWYKEAFIEGQSYYLCGYLSKTGGSASYWQINLMQQANGKSIVFAKTGENPGVKDGALFADIFKLGYFGPIMIEVIKNKLGDLYYIETNPRFWGPLQLALDTCPRILDLYSFDCGANNLRSNRHVSSGWYAWAAGAKQPNCKRYPELEKITGDVVSLMTEHDVYRKEDSYQLYNNY
jgi:hypothetical protein